MRIEIDTPGQLSRVASPIALRTWLMPGPDGKVYLELIGEDGRLLYRKIQGVTGTPGRKVEFSLDIEFEIPGVSELARLILYTKDSFNRVIAMNSVDLVLLSSGRSDPNPGGDQLERVVVQFPPPNASIQGGSLVVQGIARPQYGPFVVAELITETGAIAGWRLITVSDGPLDQFRSFSGEISYDVSTPTRVLLVVRESTERIKGVTYLTSQPLLLRP